VRWKEAYDRLQAMLEALPDLLFVLDRDGRIHDYHAPTLDRLYVPPDRFLGRTMNEVLPEPARGIVDWAIQDAVVHGFHRGSVYPLATPSGKRWFEISIAAQGDPNRPEGRLVSIVRDITERRVAQETLRESEAQFRMLTEGMKDVAWVFDAEDRRFSYVSPSVEALRGYTPEEILASPFEEALVPEQREEVAALLGQSVARFLRGEIDENAFFTLQILQPCKDGRRVPSEAVCRIVRNPRTGRLEVHGITRDMSARVRAEEAVKQSEQQLRQIMDLVPHFIFAKDAEGRFILANQALADAYGTTVENILGQTDAQFDASAEEVRHFREDDLTVMASGTPLVVPEETITDSQGRQRILSTTKIPFTCSDLPDPAILGVSVDITDLKRAEAALRERDERFKEIAAQSRMLVWEVDASGLYTYVNEVCLDLAGYRPEELIGKRHFYDFHPPERREELKAAAFQIMQSRARFEHFENPVLARDGTVFWVSTTAEPLLGEDGALLGYRGSSLDITGRKRAEDALRESEERFAQSARQSRTFLWETDVNGLYTFVSPVVEDVLGYLPEELVGKLRYDELFPEEDRRRLRKEAAQIIRGGHDFQDFENPCRAKDGRIVWVVTSGGALRDARGEVCGYRGSDTDITKRKQAEQALRDSRDRLNRAQELAHMGSWELDAASDNLNWSDEVYRIFDLKPEEFAGTYEAFLECVHPEDRANVHAAYRESLHNGTDSYEIEHRIVRRKSREVRWVHEKCFHSRDDHGRLVRSVGMVLDITERRQTEDALKESQARWRALNDNLPGGLVYQIDSGVDGTERHFRLISQGVEKLHGLTIAEVLADAEALYGQVHEDDQPRVAELEKRAAETMTPFAAEVRCRLPGGALRWRLFTSAPRRLPNGHLVWDGLEWDITERKQAEEALKESRTRIQALSDNLPGGLIYQLDSGQAGERRQILYISQGVELLHGLTPEEVMQDSARLYGQVVEEDRPLLAARTVQAAKAMTPMHVEMRCRHPSGDIRWIYACSAPRRMPNGHMIWDGIELDITERKQAEEALRKSEAKYRLLHESMRDAFCRVDLSGRILETNAAFQTLVGYSQEELSELAYQDLTPERWHAGEDQILADLVMTRGYSDIYQKEYRHRDGTIIPIELRTVLIRDETGEPAGMWATVRNITARLRVERALHQATVELERRVKERTAELEASRQALVESEAQFRQMTDIIQEVFWLIDAMSGEALYVSPAFEQIWGRSPSKNRPSVFTWVDSLHPDDRAHALEVFRAGLKVGQFEPLEVRVVRPDGSLRWIEVRGWLMSPARGGRPRVAGTMRDITMRRQLEAEILNASEAERQRIGRDLHDSLGQSLTGIGYLAEAMKEELSRAGRPESAEAGKLARLVEEAADRAHAMARGLMLVDMRRGGLTAALQELALRTQELFHIECRYEGPEEITLDDMETAGQLYRIAQEAATNAAKHARTDLIVIRLEATPAKLELTVRDTGKGLLPDETDATGMGLGIMRYRAGLIGASFSIEGAAGRGTTIHCHLARTRLNQKEDPHENDPGKT
jgi:PAS domain S-box-containing protein